MKRSKKLLAFILACIMLLSLVPMSVSAVDAATEEGNQISTPEDFMGMAAGGMYYLTGDIDFSKDSDDWAGDNSAYSFNADGKLVVSSLVSTPWYGMLNGKGYSIYGFELAYEAEDSSTASKNVGVFAELNNEKTTVISDIKIGKTETPVKATVIANGETVNFGFLAGCSNPYSDEADVNYYQLMIDNVTVNGNATVSSDGSGEHTVGGVIGSGYYLNITNSVANGSIAVNGTAVSAYVGGIVGSIEQRQGHADHDGTLHNCVNNVIVNTDEITAENDELAAGGIIGMSECTINITNCVNNSAVSANSEKLGGIIGYVADNMDTSKFVLIADCVNADASLNIYGERNESVKKMCVIGCKDGTVDSEDNTPIYDPDKAETYSSIYDYVMPLSSAADFAKINDDVTTTDADESTGFYCLTGDIDFTTDEPRTSYIVQYFNGVLYGGGYKLENLQFQQYEDSLIRLSARTADAAIVNLQLGDAENPAKVTASSSGSTGILTTWMGVAGNDADDTGFTTTVCGVDVYVDIDNKEQFANATRVGGMAAKAGSVVFLDSNVYGSIEKDTKTTSAGVYVGGFCGQNDRTESSKRQMYIGCNNYADVTVAGVPTGNSATGGFIGSNHGSRGVVFLNCNNFGNITGATDGGKATYHSDVAAFAGLGNNTECFVFFNCANFGDLKGNKCAVLMARSAAENTVCKAIDIENFGKVYYETAPQNKYFCLAGGTIEFIAVDTHTEDFSVASNETASVRFNAEDTGIRFKSKISDEAVQKLKDIYGADVTVTYGTLIAPTIFAESAGDASFAAIDAFVEANKELFGDTKAYVDVPASKWFVGKNGEETGWIAGSILGVNENGLSGENFTGRGYIKVADKNGKELVTLYSATFAVRSVETVAQAAYDDVLYTNDNGTTWYTDEACTDQLSDEDKKDPAEYTVNLSGDAAVKKYTCYTAEQYDCLKAILGK